jgi:hypothetical protein
MRKFTRVLVAIFLGFSFVTAAFAIDVPLKYQKHPAESEDFYPYGSNGFKVTLKKPSGDWTFPAFVSGKALYTLVKIGDAERLCVLDKQKEDAEFYNRIYFDSNGNNDLTDDAVLDGTIRFGSNNQYCYVDFQVSASLQGFSATCWNSWPNLNSMKRASAATSTS